jgi:hypothetical protein
LTALCMLERMILADKDGGVSIYTIGAMLSLGVRATYVRARPSLHDGFEKYKRREVSAAIWKYPPLPLTRDCKVF